MSWESSYDAVCSTLFQALRGGTPTHPCSLVVDHPFAPIRSWALLCADVAGHSCADSGEAEKLRLDNPAKLRFTAQQPFAVAPKNAPLRWQGFGCLREVMAHYNNALEALFWEALDLPLDELEQLKTLKVRTHWHARTHAHASALQPYCMRVPHLVMVPAS